MTALAHELARLLDAERQAAVSADVDRLISLQWEKRVVIDQMRAAGEPARPPAELAERARGNLALMRHLVRCLRALAEPDGAATYTAAGARKFAELPTGIWTR